MHSPLKSITKHANKCYLLAVQPSSCRGGDLHSCGLEARPPLASSAPSTPLAWRRAGTPPRGSPEARRPRRAAPLEERRPQAHGPPGGTPSQALAPLEAPPPRRSPPPSARVSASPSERASRSGFGGGWAGVPSERVGAARDAFRSG
jgi:hypothetical protein